MRYLSVCSGIEAATVAWHPLGWRAAAFSEIEKFPRAVLSHHYPDVPLHGDFTTIGANEYGPIDLLVGGTPCQSFSIAGLRGGLGDDRGNLALEYLRLADRTRPRWLVWENVPGVLSSNGGRDFGSILGGMGELGYGFAYRVLDAQFFGVPQRRRRVFVVGYIGDWRRAAAVLFERHSLQGNPAPRRETGERVAGNAISCAETYRWQNNQAGIVGDDCAASLRAKGTTTDERSVGDLVKWPADVAPTLNAHFGDKMGLENQHALNGAGHFVPAIAFAQNTRDEVRLQGGDGQISGALAAEEGMKQRTYIAFSAKDHGADAMEDCSPTLRAGGHSKSHANAGVMPAVAFKIGQGAKAGGIGAQEECAPTLSAAESGTNRTPGLLHNSAVRRLTPVECERLQGFPDDYTMIPWRGKDPADCPDGPRYKALGNSMAVPVMRWIGERIEAVEAITAREAA